MEWTNSDSIWTAIIIIVWLTLPHVEDWINAWRGHEPESEPDTHFRDSDQLDDMERGYNDAAGWLLFGCGLKNTEESLIGTWTTADYDEGVWQAIADWQRQFPNSEKSQPHPVPETNEVYHGA